MDRQAEIEEKTGRLMRMLEEQMALTSVATRATARCWCGAMAGDLSSRTGSKCRAC
jgi:hypothetical protein